MEHPQARLRVGSEFSYAFVVSREMINKFGEATGDMNPIHFCTDEAKRAGFAVADGKVIAHGMLVVASAAGKFTKMFPQTVLTAMSKLRFIQPVQNEDTVEVSGVVKDITLMPERGGAAVEISMRFRVNKKLVIGGSVIAFTRLPTE